MLSLADAIIEENIHDVRQLLQYGEDVNEIDEYGFTPLIEAAIVENVEIARLLLEYHASPSQQDVTGSTPLHWAAENNNLNLCKLLLSAEADPNAYTFSGQPVLAMPTLRRQAALKKLLIQHGADQTFADDYINTKLLGHMFELVGVADIVDTHHQYVEVDFEGFYLEITLSLIADSLAQFQNHFVAGKLRRYGGLAQYIVGVLENANELIQYQQYRVNRKKHMHQIDTLLQKEPVLVPVGYEGHAITFIKYGDIWIKCDRREDSRLYDNIVFYRITHIDEANLTFLKTLLYEKQNDIFINQQLPRILGLEPITELKVEAQISGNCSWANVEATIPILFFLILSQLNTDQKATSYYKTLALNFFHQWREWNKDRALHYCIQSFEQANAVRKACKAEILAAILFQRCDDQKPADRERIQLILSVLLKSPYAYLLQNYLRVYYYQNKTEEGTHFANLLKEHGFP